MSRLVELSVTTLYVHAHVLFISQLEEKSPSIIAQAAATFVASVTSAPVSIHASFDISLAVVNLLVVEVSSRSSGSSTTAHVDQLTLNT